MTYVLACSIAAHIIVICLAIRGIRQCNALLKQYNKLR